MIYRKPLIFMKPNGGVSGASRQKGGVSGNIGNQGIPVAKTIDEANALAVNLGLAGRANFTGIDVPCANTLIQALNDTHKIIPALGAIPFFGSDIQYEGKVGKYALAAVYSEYDKSHALVLSSSKFNTQNLTSILGDLKLAEALRVHPLGTASIKGVIDHEIGHVLDHLNASVNGKLLNEDKVIKGLFRQYGGKKHYIMERNLSSYASTSTKEFIAEAWSEYRNNPEPRPAAKAVGSRIMELLGGQSK